MNEGLTFLIGLVTAIVLSIPGALALLANCYAFSGFAVTVGWSGFFIIIYAILTGVTTSWSLSWWAARKADQEREARWARHEELQKGNQ